MGLLGNKKAQALLELAIFASLILFIFGVLLSYMQRQNDQQYVQMEAFRRTLEKGCISGGAIAQETVLQNRRNVDVGNYFMKGSSQALSASSNVFWPVLPAGGSNPPQRVFVRVNEDESPDLVDEEPVEDINTASTTVFTENVVKQENPKAIKNIKTSTLKDTVTTTLLDEDGNEIWKVEQGIYRDSDGQYKYSKIKKDTEVERAQTWDTEF